MTWLIIAAIFIVCALWAGVSLHRALKQKEPYNGSGSDGVRYG